jgi:hypothetical protein
MSKPGRAQKYHKNSREEEGARIRRHRECFEENILHS